MAHLIDLGCANNLYTKDTHQMETWKYQLRKGSRKDICPSCRRRTFVSYVLASDNNTIVGEEFGRCDREHECGYFRHPGKNERVTIEAPAYAFEPMRLSRDLVQVSTKSVLFDFAVKLCSKYGHEADEVVEAWRRYKVGATMSEEVVFWQIDSLGAVRSGKIMKYEQNGHRSKENGSIRWAHNVVPKTDREGKDLEQCLFGQHLVKDEDSVPIAIVESEKTALLMSVLRPEWLWLACGGASNLQDEKISFLVDKDVTLFPDNGKAISWGKIAERNGFGLDLQCECHPVDDGCDVLDYYNL